MKQIQKNKNRYIVSLCLAFVIGAIVSGAGALLFRNNNPTVLVWSADREVRVPDGLVSYLERTATKDCRDYKGTNSVTGVALFSIYDSYENRLAKMTYGCGSDLTNQYNGYILAYHEEGKWNLSQPTEYFVTAKPATPTDTPSYKPLCSFLSDHNVPADFEPECATEDGALVTR